MVKEINEIGSVVVTDEDSLHELFRTTMYSHAGIVTGSFLNQLLFNTMYCAPDAGKQFRMTLIMKIYDEFARSMHVLIANIEFYLQLDRVVSNVEDYASRVQKYFWQKRKASIVQNMLHKNLKHRADKRSGNNAKFKLALLRIHQVWRTDRHDNSYEYFEFDEASGKYYFAL